MAAKKKIYLVEANVGTEQAQTFLVKAFNTVGAERVVRERLQPEVEARLPEQDELIDLTRQGLKVIDPDAPAPDDVAQANSGGDFDPNQLSLSIGADAGDSAGVAP